MTVLDAKGNEYGNQGYAVRRRKYSGKDVDYVIQAIKEKMIRDGEIDGEENISELSTEDVSCEDEN